MYLVVPCVVVARHADESLREKFATVAWAVLAFFTYLWGVSYALRGYLLTRYLGCGLDGCRSGATSLDVLRHVGRGDRCSMRRDRYLGMSQLQLPPDDLGHGTPVRGIIISTGRDMRM
jgi:hypothetical protein